MQVFHRHTHLIVEVEKQQISRDIDELMWEGTGCANCARYRNAPSTIDAACHIHMLYKCRSEVLLPVVLLLLFIT